MKGLYLIQNVVKCRMTIPSYSTTKISPEQYSPEEPREQKAPEPRKNSGLRKWLGLAFRLACTIALFVFLFKSVSWSSLLQKVGQLDDGVLLIGIIVGLAGVVISSYQWQVLLDGERIRVDLKKLVNLYLVGIAFNHFLPTGMGGDVVKAYYVGQEEKNGTGSASAAIMSRVTGYIGMLFISVPALLIWHRIFSRSLTVSYLLSCLAMCGALVGTVVFVAVLPRLIKGKWAQWRVLSSVIKVGQAILVSVRRPRFIISSILFGMLFHLSAALNYYTYSLALHMQVPFTFYLVAIPFVSLVAFLPFSINGFGIRESVLVFLFSTMHVPASTSLLLVLLADAQSILFAIVGGYLYLSMGRLKRVKSGESSALIAIQEAVI
jgi:glycosyltransferase 2 family protein